MWAVCVMCGHGQVHAPFGSTEKRAAFAKQFGNKMRQGAARRAAGVIQVPTLVDPNVSDEPIFESAEIVRYLYATYSVAEDSHKKR